MILAPPGRGGPPPVHLAGLLGELDRAFGCLGDLRAEIVAAALPPDPALEEARTMMARQADELVGLSRGFFRHAARWLDPPRLRPSPTRLDPLLRRIDARHAPAAAARGLGWSCTREGPDAEVSVDLGLLLEAVGHLIDNALRFTPEGGGVRVRAGADSAGWWLRLEDDGPGIPPDLIRQVAEPLFRSGPPGAGVEQGHGLGLTECLLLVHRLGGTLELGPGARGGTEAVIRLPGGASA